MVINNGNITLTLDTPDIQAKTLNLEISNSKNLSLQGDPVIERITSDYNRLQNKPSINGTELVGNYDEIDPTVPEWAKQEEPEEYSLSSIRDLWESIFN